MSIAPGFSRASTSAFDQMLRSPALSATCTLSDVGARRDVGRASARARSRSCRSARSTPSSRASCSRQRPVLPVEPAAPDHDVHAEAGGAADHLAADAADAEQRRASARRARAPSNTPSCSRRRRAARRRCRARGDRAPSIRRERELRDGNGVLAGTVRDVDAARSTRPPRRWCCSRRRRGR